MGMKRNLLVIAFSALWSTMIFAQTTQPATAPVDPGKPTELVQKRGPRAESFLQRHHAFLQRIEQGPINLLFLGDSITAGWAGPGKEIWAEKYAPLNAANFGIGGDQTQNVLWRIHNGELDNFKPKAVVLMIGTNNTGQDSPEDIAAGIAMIVETIRTKLPETKILLLGVFPRQRGREQQITKIAEINTLISRLDDGKHVRFLDIGTKFRDAEGKLPADVMPDGLHLSAKGYQIWSEAMAPLLNELMK